MDDQERTKPDENSKGNLQPGDNNRDRLKDGVSMPKDWRDLAQRIQEETDSEKLVDMVQELICKFDEERLRKKGMPRPTGTT